MCVTYLTLVVLIIESNILILHLCRVRAEEGTGLSTVRQAASGRSWNSQTLFSLARCSFCSFSPRLCAPALTFILSRDSHRLLLLWTFPSLSPPNTFFSQTSQSPLSVTRAFPPTGFVESNRGQTQLLTKAQQVTHKRERGRCKTTGMVWSEGTPLTGKFSNKRTRGSFRAATV